MRPIILAAACFVSFAATVSSQQSQATNLIENGSFEADSLPPRLEFHNVPKGKEASDYFKLDSKVKASGEKSLRFEMDEAGATYWKENSNPSYSDHIGLIFQFDRETIQRLQGKKIKVQAKMFLQSGSIRAVCWVRQGNKDRSIDPPFPAVTVEGKKGEWVTLGGEGNIAPDAVSVQLLVDMKVGERVVY